MSGPGWVDADAPGRVNLIGEHTDYNGGFVLPTAIPQRTRVRLHRRSDQTAQVLSAWFGDGQYTLGSETPGRGWLDYVQGVTWALRQEGCSLSGFEAQITSEVPAGSGLASSAALEVSLLRALRRAFELPLDELHLARIGQRAENDFVGARVGIMDQMAASLADANSALFLDTRTRDYRRIPLPRGAELVVLHSGVTHEHAAGEYNARRAECERACALLGVRQLRELGATDLPRIAALPEPLGRRARHVVRENERVLQTVTALQAGDLDGIGDLFYASHASMRDDYEVSVAELDLLVELARRELDIFGARLTGGGFGGSVVMLARVGAARTAGERIARDYARQSGCQPTLLVPMTRSTG